MSDYEIIKYILNDINEDLDDEEKVHLLLNKTVSENNECKESFGQRASDRLSSLAGSWTFVIGFTLLLLVWITVNTVFPPVTGRWKPFAPAERSAAPCCRTAPAAACPR